MRTYVNVLYLQHIVNTIIYSILLHIYKIYAFTILCILCVCVYMICTVPYKLRFTCMEVDERCTYAHSAYVQNMLGLYTRIKMWPWKVKCMVAEPLIVHIFSNPWSKVFHVFIVHLLNWWSIHMYINPWKYIDGLWTNQSRRATTLEQGIPGEWFYGGTKDRRLWIHWW